VADGNDVDLAVYAPSGAALAPAPVAVDDLVPAVGVPLRRQLLARSTSCEVRR